MINNQASGLLWVQRQPTSLFEDLAILITNCQNPSYLNSLTGLHFNLPVTLKGTVTAWINVQMLKTSLKLKISSNFQEITLYSWSESALSRSECCIMKVQEGQQERYRSSQLLFSFKCCLLKHFIYPALELYHKLFLLYPNILFSPTLNLILKSVESSF